MMARVPRYIASIICDWRARAALTKCFRWMDRSEKLFPNKERQQ